MKNIPKLPSETETWSTDRKVKFLARLAHELTVCARDTCETGTDKVLQPEPLRHYNEIQHRVTASLRDHLIRSEGGMPLNVVLEMLKDFGVRYHKEVAMRGAISDADRDS